MKSDATTDDAAASGEAQVVVQEVARPMVDDEMGAVPSFPFSMTPPTLTSTGDDLGTVPPLLPSSSSSSDWTTMTTTTLTLPSSRGLVAAFDDDDDDRDREGGIPPSRRPPFPAPSRRRHRWQRRGDDDALDSTSIYQPRLAPSSCPSSTPPSTIATEATESTEATPPPTTVPTAPTLVSLPVEVLVRAATYLHVDDVRSLASSCRSSRASLARGRCAAVELWTSRMGEVFPAVFHTKKDDYDYYDDYYDDDGRALASDVVFVDDLRLPIVAASTFDAEDDNARADVNLPLLAGLIPRRYPQRIDPRTLTTGSWSESDDDDDDIDIDIDDDDYFVMVMFGGERRRFPRRLRRASNARRPRRVAFRSYVSTATTELDGAVVEEGTADDIDDVDDDRADEAPGADAVLRLPVIRFVGDRVGTGERCVRSDYPFPPDCRRVVASSSSCVGRRGGAGGGGSAMSGFLSSLSGCGVVVGGGGIDGDARGEDPPGDNVEEVEAEDQDYRGGGVAPVSPGKLILSKCKSSIIGRLSSLRGLKRAMSSGRRDGRDDDDDVVVGHLRPFVVPTVISDARGTTNTGYTTGRGRGMVVDVTPRLVAYFEVTILRTCSSSSVASAAGRLAVVGGVDADGNNHQRMEDAAGDRRQVQRRQENRRQNFNQVVWMPMMMMPVHPFPMEFASMMNALEWDGFPLGAGGGRRLGGGGGFSHGAFAHQQQQEHERHQYEMQRRRERRRQENERRQLEWQRRRETQRRERERQGREWNQRREERRRGGARREEEVDARRERRGHRHECVAIGLSTRSFSPADKMPGWDCESFGYHGDDGGIYHGRGDMLHRYGPSYGPGDTVGCGLDYSTRRIFFVKNGVFLGYAFGNGSGSVGVGGAGGGLSREIIDTGLYPTVGVDTECPISVNFGERPFRFDLRGFAAASVGGK